MSQELDLLLALNRWTPVTFGPTPSANVGRIDIPPRPGYRTQIGFLSVYDSTSSGGSPVVQVYDGATKIEHEAFTAAAGNNKRLQYGANPLSATEGNTVSIVTALGTLTAVSIYATYRQIPA